LGKKPKLRRFDHQPVTPPKVEANKKGEGGSKGPLWRGKGTKGATVNEEP